MSLKGESYYRNLIEEIKTQPRSGNVLWDEAYAISDLIESDYYLTNYNSLRKLAEDIGISKAKLISYKKAVEFDKKYHFEKSLYSVNIVYILSCLGSMYPDFVDYTKKQHIDYIHTTQAEFKNIIRDFKEHYYSKNNHSKSKKTVVKATLYSLDLYFWDIEKAKDLFSNYLNCQAGIVYAGENNLVYHFEIDGVALIRLNKSKKNEPQDIPPIHLSFKIQCNNWSRFLTTLKDNGYDIRPYSKNSAFLQLESVLFILHHDISK